MDALIARMPFEADGDLMLCHAGGVAYQAVQGQQIAYDEAYYRKCDAHAAEMVERINRLRVEFVARHYTGELLDIGIGSGAFIKARGAGTYGYDVNPVAAEWLRRSDLWSASIGTFGALTFWDVLEHCPDPGLYLRAAKPGVHVFASIPVFDDLRRIRASKHYRPDEHLTYWTDWGFVDWMAAHGFLLLEVNDDETRAGRESIKSFAFRHEAWSQ